MAFFHSRVFFFKKFDVLIFFALSFYFIQFISSSFKIIKFLKFKIILKFKINFESLMFYSKCYFKFFIKFYQVFQVLKLSSLKFKNFILEIYQVLYFKIVIFKVLSSLSSFKIFEFYLRNLSSSIF